MTGKEQVQDDSDHPETRTAGDGENPDAKHDLDSLGHAEASLYRFVDRPLPLDAVLTLGSQYLDRDAQAVAEALDSLVIKGLLRFADGFVERPGVSDTYNSRLPGSQQSELDAEGKKGGDPMKAVYEEWNAIARRHPEWTITMAPGHEQENVRVDLDDPSGSMDALRGKVRYNPDSVRPDDLAEFRRFLELDAKIEAFEASGGYHKGASLRAQALWRMAGGALVGIGLFAAGVRLVRAAAGLGRGDLVQALAEEKAEREHGSALETLPMEEQVRLMQEAEQESLERFPMTSQADFGMGGDDDQPPAPDPEKAPQGWEKITGPDGKSNWRSKTDPNTKLERPDANA